MAAIALTEAAAEKVKELLRRDGRYGWALRVRVIKGGCSGLRYDLSFEDHVADTDLAAEQHGVRVVVDPESAAYVTGGTLSYVDDLSNSGFQFQNPTASSTCGCGESFDV